MVRDEEDEYVLNDEELEVENEDQKFETDDEDAVSSNEEKNEDEESDEEEETVCEEEANDKKSVVEEKMEKKDDTKPKTTTTVPLQTAVKSQTVTTPVVQSVIREPPTVMLSPMTTDKSDSNIIHQRLSPEVTNKQALPQLPFDSSKTVKALDKRKQQVKKCPLPNPPVDYAGGGCYPCPDATQVDSIVPSSPIHTASVSYNRPHVTVSTSAGKFKPVGTVAPPPSGFLAGPYRTTNKIVTEAVTASVPSSRAYLPPQVSQVYQAPLPNNYSSYPIDYAAVGTPLPPPPPAIPFRNMVVMPTQLHENHPPLPTTVITQQHSVPSAGGDSEFGGLVSYFSSQQEDDFDS